MDVRTCLFELAEDCYIYTYIHTHAHTRMHTYVMYEMLSKDLIRFSLEKYQEYAISNVFLFSTQIE